jgi:hypothetical protein
MEDHRLAWFLFFTQLARPRPGVVTGRGQLAGTAGGRMISAVASAERDRTQPLSTNR